MVATATHVTGNRKRLETHIHPSNVVHPPNAKNQRLGTRIEYTFPSSSYDDSLILINSLILLKTGLLLPILFIAVLVLARLLGAVRRMARVA